MQAHISNTPSARSQASLHACICDIELRAKKTPKRVKLLIDNHEVERWENDRDKNHQVTMTFDPPLVLPSKTITLSMTHGGWSLTSLDITITKQELSDKYNHDTKGRQEYRWLHRNTEVIIGLTQQVPEGDTEPLNQDNKLRPTTEEILQVCPQFRILVIGKSGAGKSSLINKTFGVTDAKVSDNSPGQADINKEIPSKENHRFLLHDSQGFEHGENNSVRIVQQFIDLRNKKPNIKDKLHAIWVCIEIPYAGGRLLEVGVEEFFKLKIGGQLGQVPVIAVFTKYDMLVSHEKMALRSSGLREEALNRQAEINAAERLEKEWVGPFKEAANGVIPVITVSTRPKYAPEMLPQLISTTYKHVYGYLEEASIVSAIAQIVNPRVKIDASIDVGKRKYWRSLTSSTVFSGVTLKKCLDVIHTDIVDVWNFEDPHKYLHSEEFKSLMSHIADIPEGHRHSNPNRKIPAGLSMVVTLATIVTIYGPMAPIILPIVAPLVFAKWVADIYDRSNTVITHLMAYIVDLTLVMQNIYWLKVVKINAHPVSRRLIKLAVGAYEKSDARSFTHADTLNFIKESSEFHTRQETFKKIVSIIQEYRIESTEMFELGSKMGLIDLTGDDENWGAL